MRRIMGLIFALAVLVSASLTQLPCAAEHGGHEHGGKEHAGKEHGGKEHGGKEHGGETTVKPSAKNIRQAMKDYAVARSAKTGAFDIFDPVVRRKRRLSLVRIHRRVGKTGEYYYSCADFRDNDTGELLDLDLDVEDRHGNLSVVDVRIHKLDGKERYTYDSNDNRIPVRN
jgi:hypothetical protein